MEMVKPKLEKGLIQVYTGNGKGKTSAAFGLALRAIGNGLKVFVIQFIKGGFDYGELHAAKFLPNLELRAFGRGKFISKTPPDKEDVELAREGFELAKNVIEGGNFDVVILDEINVAMHLKLLGVNNVLDLIRNKPKHVELVLTGRNAPSEIVEIADLVTEMREVKHPYALGVQPRKGIEY
jgi:cob(I)alamin adenosyltransferase